MPSRRRSSRPLLTAITCAALAAVSAPHVASAANQPAEGPDAETMKKAKKLFMEAEKAFGKEDYATAADKYEQAYYLLPEKHGFAYKVGMASWKSGNCPRAYQYFRHFVQYETDTEGKAAEIEESKRILGEIAVQECAGEAADQGGSGDPTAPVTGEGPDLSKEADEPGLGEASDEPEKEKKKNGLLIGGVASLVVGAAGIGVGIGTRVVARRNADELESLASRNTMSGFAEGDFSDPSTKDLQDSLPPLNAASIAGFTVGGVGLALGGALIGLHFARKGKAEAPADATAKRVATPMVTPSFSRDGGGASFSMRF